MTPTCPQCRKILTNVAFFNTRIGPLFTEQGYKGIIYGCPYCSHVLGVGVDPVALKDDVIEQVVDRLKTVLNEILRRLPEG